MKLVGDIETKKNPFGGTMKVAWFRPEGNFSEKVIEFMEKVPLDKEGLTIEGRDDGDWGEGRAFAFHDKDGFVKWLKNPDMTPEMFQVSGRMGGKRVDFAVVYTGPSEVEYFAVDDTGPLIWDYVQDFE